MPEIVKEFPTDDGIGAMLWKKIYAMSYAKQQNKLFEDTPLKWFLIHSSDNIKSEDDPKYAEMLEKFNNVLLNPWKDIDFDSIPDKTLCPHIGLGWSHAPGIIAETDFLDYAPEFNKFSDTVHNSIVIHIRRGNAVPENPRYTEDKFYFNLLKDIPKIIQDLQLDNPRVIITTDARNEEPYTPVGEKQKMFNCQPYLHKDEFGRYPTTGIDIDLLKSAYPNVEIIDYLDTYDAFILMLTAKVLIVGNSAFSQSAGLLSTNMVIAMPPKEGMSHILNRFKNKVGQLNKEGRYENSWNQ
jgi:hypothetical protein